MIKIIKTNESLLLKKRIIWYISINNWKMVIRRL